MKPTDKPVSLEQEELRGLARTVAEIEWLLLVLVLLFQAFGGPKDEGRIAIAMAMMFFAAFVLIFRYTNFYRNESRWKIAIETWVMIVFIIWSVYYTGKLESPLLNCFLLVIITSALTLGKVSTAAELAAIGAALLVLGGQPPGVFPTLESLGGIAVLFVPFVLVAYITTMFSADIRYGLSKAVALSETDELTGLLNRRSFAVNASRVFGQAVRYNRSVGVLVIDSDNLKQVNDQYGHGAGDDLLRLLAQCIQHELRTTDMLFRQGGDEFVVLLPETDRTRSGEVAERVRRAVESTRSNTDGEMIKTTVSIGIATYPADGRVMETILANADKALYRAKASGRNRAVQFSDAALTAGQQGA